VPWTTTSPMSLRLDFVHAVHQRHWPITELCRGFQISEKTGHKWLARFAAEGEPGLVDRPPLAHAFPHQLPPAVAAALLACRTRHPTWGPRKLRAYLARTRPRTAWPAPSTIGALLHRHGRVRPRRRPGGGPARWAPLDQPLTRAQAPNDVWTTDFKGEFRLGSGAYCYPLTVLDADSRFLLECRALASTASAAAHRVFTRLFHTYGLPHVIRSDNGVPFASPLALSRLSTLAVWWIRLGIRPERIVPGAPQQNGAHERMHKTLKAETTRPLAASAARQQARFNAFRHEYNTERPHEALGLQVPASRYHASPRPMPTRLPELEYPAHVEIRRVQTTGMIRWRGTPVCLTTVLAGEAVALDPIDADEWRVSFGPLVLGTLHEPTRSFTPESYWKMDDMDPHPTP
jgi:putative transposase